MKRALLVLLCLLLLLLGAAAAWVFGKHSLDRRSAIFDVDGDGVLGRQEVGPVVRQRFDHIDRNRDGVLDGVEVRRYTIASLLAGRGRPAPAPEPEIAAGGPSFADVTAYLDDTVRAAGLDGIALLVGRNGETLYRHGIGNLESSAVVPVASGSKWLTAALLMSLVDEGTLELDRPLARHLPYLDGTPAASVTLRQALSHTSGLGSNHMLTLPFDLDLAAAARAAANTPRIDQHAPAFHYTGAAMQLAGAAAEAATGRSWQELFEERIAGPLAMADTSYGHPMRDIDFEANRTVVVETGVHTTLDDYARFLEMIDAWGAVGGGRVLSVDAIRTMEVDHTAGLTVSFVPPGARSGWGYALGAWCEQTVPELQCTKLNSAGAFGAFPWLDRSRDLYGVLLVVDAVPRMVDRILAIRRLVEEVVDRADATQPPAEP
jgi:CubicO group peptidase (beta-lactamase class C family)